MCDRNAVELEASILSFPFASVNITLLDTFHIVGSVIHPDSFNVSSLNVSEIGESEILPCS